jgi:hypothetical protein
VSLVAYFVIARPIVGIALGDGLSGPTKERTRDYGRHAAEFALVGLGRRSPTSTGGRR